MLQEKLIEIKTKVVNDVGEEDVIEMQTVGKFGVKDGKAYVSYDDSASLGAEGVTTILKADKNTVILKRTGPLPSRLEIEKGERHQCHYSTLYGDLSVGIFGEILENNLTDNGGSLSMSYTIDINCEFLSRNNVEIRVR